MKEIRGYKWFCRITKTNYIKESDTKYEYDFENVYNELKSKYDRVMYIVHDKDIDNVHAHIIIQNDSQIRKSTLLKIMPYGDCDIQEGSNREVYDYLLHKNKKDKEPYSEESIICNFNSDLDEWLNKEKKKKEEYDSFIEDAYDGLTDEELSEKYPKYFFTYSNRLDKIREINNKKMAQEPRELEVFYYYGESRTGKTYSAMEYCKKNGLSCYRVTDYERDPFESYNGENVLILEEYHYNFNINTLLTWLEGYPNTKLPSRYKNKYALYTKVFIISNISLKEQYLGLHSETKKALENRINSITYFTKEKITVFKNNNIISEIANPLFEKKGPVIYHQEDTFKGFESIVRIEDEHGDNYEN
ncbi:MAG: Rep family protein [Ignavibacteriales bacterium]